MSSKSKTVVISDIHIGDNSPTTWYRRDVHEPYLAHVLPWVIDRQNEIRELVILGDLVDVTGRRVHRRARELGTFPAFGKAALWRPGTSARYPQRMS